MSDNTRIIEDIEMYASSINPITLNNLSIAFMPNSSEELTPAISIRYSLQDLRSSGLKKSVLQDEVSYIEFNADVFSHSVDNKNDFGFFTDDMPLFASSFNNKPFLRDHNWDVIDSRDGTIVESQLFGDWFRQKIRLTTKRGMIDFLEGKIDRFSIGFDARGIQCSICSGDILNCEHFPGITYNGVRCKALFVSPNGNETSAVNVPAVPGTRILSIDTMSTNSNFTGFLSRNKLYKGGQPMGNMTQAEEGAVTPDSQDSKFVLTNLTQTITDHVMGVIGSEESVLSLASAMGISELEQRLAKIETDYTNLLNQVRSLLGEPTVTLSASQSPMNWQKRPSRAVTSVEDVRQPENDGSQAQAGPYARKLGRSEKTLARYNSKIEAKQ